MKRKSLFLLVALFVVGIGAKADNIVAIVMSDGGAKYYSTFGNAITAANALSGATVILVDDCKYGTNGDGLYNITSSMTVDGNGHTLSGYGSRDGKATTLAINSGGSSAVDVTIKNLTIETDGTDARAIETRGNVSSLTLENVTITATSDGENRGLTFGGNQSSVAEINILNSSIDAGKNGYSYTSYNPADVVIKDCTFSGVCAMRLYGVLNSTGSRGTCVKATDSQFNTTGESSDYGVFHCQDDGISVELENCKVNAGATQVASQAVYTLGSETSSDRCTETCSLAISGDNTVVNSDMLVSAFDGSAPLECTVSGGIYSARPDDSYVVSGKAVNQNTDESTKSLYPYVIGDDQTVVGTVYAGGSSAVADQSLEQFAAVRSTYPNAVMIVDEKYAELVKGQANVIVRYSAGGNGNYYYECPDFELTDPADLSALSTETSVDYSRASFYTPVNFVAVSGSYSRSLHAKSQSCCLPFAISGSDDVKLQTFAYYECTADSRQYVYFNQPEMVTAGVPCLLYCDAATTFNRTFDNTEIVAEPVNAYNMKGTFAASSEFNKDCYYGMLDNGLQFGTAPETLYSFRSVLSLGYDAKFNNGENHTQSGAKTLDIAVIGADDATGISGTCAEHSLSGCEGDIYNLYGARVEKVNLPGLYIVNGKKVYIK